VGQHVSASGFPLPGGPAHRAPEVIPFEKYSAWALQPHEQGREQFHLFFTIGKLFPPDKEYYAVVGLGTFDAIQECMSKNCNCAE